MDDETFLDRLIQATLKLLFFIFLGGAWPKSDKEDKPNRNERP